MANRQRKLNITDYRGNASQNHTDIAPHTCQNGYHQKEHHKCWRGRAEKESLHTVHGNVNWGSQCRKRYGGCLKN